MKFNCGPTSQEKYYEKVRQKKAWIKDHIEDTKWFAWKPVRLANTKQCVWWEYVNRRLNTHSLGYAEDNYWDYYKPWSNYFWIYSEIDDPKAKT